MAEREPINPAQEFVGRVEAVDRVELRARVTGFLQEVLFKEGELVKEGAPLYRIEPEPFQAAVQQAQGALVKAQGRAGQRHRAARNGPKNCCDQQSGSVADARQRLAEEQTRQGRRSRVADANLQTAKINLGYTEINAPITGLIGRTERDQGQCGRAR